MLQGRRGWRLTVYFMMPWEHVGYHDCMLRICTCTIDGTDIAESEWIDNCVSQYLSAHEVDR